MVKFVLGGNWKMQMGIAQSVEAAKALVDKVKGINNVDIIIAPPFTALSEVNKVVKGTNVLLAGQNMFYEDKGAYTGEIAPDYLIEAGCSYVILGHSERRRIFGETSELINKKVKKALEKGLKVILCIGETAKERQDSLKEKVNAEQLEASLKDITPDQMKKIVIAYEPVWAINSKGLNPTGDIRPATPAEADEIHKFVRGWLIKRFGEAIGKEVAIEYGGSVSTANCAELFKIKDINGGLVGGASLKPDEFAIIIKAASETKK
jgi:triosephosphate isomerase